MRDLGDGCEQLIDLVLGALDLDDQQRLDIEGVAGIGEVLADMDRGPVHELDRHGDDARSDDRGHAGARRLAGSEKPSSIGRAPSALAGCAPSPR